MKSKTVVLILTNTANNFFIAFWLCLNLSLHCPELPFSGGYFSLASFTPFNFYGVNAGLQPTACGNPGHATLPENKMLLLTVWTYLYQRLKLLGGEKKLLLLLPSLLPSHFIPFSFFFLLMLCLYDESVVASLQSRGLFCTDVTAALHNICLSCSLQSLLLYALTAVCCTYTDPCSPHFSSQVHNDLHSAAIVSASSVEC